ncbi:MAG: hypothetical protein WB764_28725 [Xanthobacteraceae bacterium]
MSVSVNGTNAQNPFALWQSLLQPDSSASNSAQSDPIASLLAALGQGQGSATGATASAGGASASSTSGTATSGSSSPQFDAQTLQTLFDMQANASNLQPVQPPLDGSTGSDDSFSSQQVQQGGANDGSAAAPTAAAPADGSTPPSASSNSSTSANVAQNNLLERLMQMQAQLINPATVQNVATA